MRTLTPGNKEGYVLIDALIAVFLAGITVVGAYGFLAVTLRVSEKAGASLTRSLERRAELALELTGENHEPE